MQAGSFVTLLHRLRAKKFELAGEDEYLTSQIAELKYAKAVRNKAKLKEKQVYDQDPIFGDYRPDWAQDPEYLRGLELLPEIRKMEFRDAQDYCSMIAAIRKDMCYMAGSRESIDDRLTDEQKARSSRPHKTCFSTR